MQPLPREVLLLNETCVVPCANAPAATRSPPTTAPGTTRKLAVLFWGGGEGGGREGWVCVAQSLGWGYSWTRCGTPAYKGG